MAAKWHFLCAGSQLRLDRTLPAGQSFRWTRLDNRSSVAENVPIRNDESSNSFTISTEGYMVFASTLDIASEHEYDLIALRQPLPTKHVLEDKIINDDKVEFTYFNNALSKNSVAVRLHRYFRLEHDLPSLYERWSHDSVFKKQAAQLTGVRLVSTLPHETLISFICSSNNNIPRITSMISSLCSTFGSYIGSVNTIPFYSFPKLHLLQDQEPMLRKLGFGYRAKYIAQTCQHLHSLSSIPPEPNLNTDLSVNLAKSNDIESYLQSLSCLSFPSLISELTQCPGVGPKVASCIALFGYSHLDAIPVDVHVARMGEKYYGVKKENVGEKMREVWGELAGWAHTVMFAKEIKWVENEDESATKEKRKRK